MARPYDSRLAAALVAPFAETRLHPNHLTTASLFVGIMAALIGAMGGAASLGVAATLYMASMFLDHADGEFARLTGKASEFGHRYDRWVDLVVKSAVFTGMGVGVARMTGEAAPAAMGFICGAAFVAIFVCRGAIGRMMGSGEPSQPTGGGFEVEDVLYLIGPVTWLGWLPGFLTLASVGAPIYAVLTFVQYRAAKARFPSQS